MIRSTRYRRRFYKYVLNPNYAKYCTELDFNVGDKVSVKWLEANNPSEKLISFCRYESGGNIIQITKRLITVCTDKGIKFSVSYKDLTSDVSIQKESAEC